MDIDKIEELIRVLKCSGTQELSVRKGECTVTLRRGPETARPAATDPECAVELEEEPPSMITAPMVGIFHRHEGLPKVGMTVQRGDVVGTIESMKLLNEVVSELSGQIVEVMVDEGRPVEYGTPLCRLEPN